MRTGTSWIEVWSSRGRRSALSIALASCCASCVPSVPPFVTHAEARAGHPAEHAEYGAVPSWAEPEASSSPPAAPRPGRALERTGYWHWNGTAYERVPAAWEAEDPAYTWAWQ